MPSIQSLAPFPSFLLTSLFQFSYPSGTMMSHIPSHPSSCLVTRTCHSCSWNRCPPCGLSHHLTLSYHPTLLDDHNYHSCPNPLSKFPWRRICFIYKRGTRWLHNSIFLLHLEELAADGDYIILSYSNLLAEWDHLHTGSSITEMFTLLSFPFFVNHSFFGQFLIGIHMLSIWSGWGESQGHVGFNQGAWVLLRHRYVWSAYTHFILRMYGAVSETMCALSTLFDWDQLACAVYTANHGPSIAVLCIYAFEYCMGWSLWMIGCNLERQ